MTRPREEDAPVRLSRSDLWDRQKAFYRREGIDAWGKVPFYATSNPYIADAYANIVIAWLRDQVARSPERASRPFYIVELGAGPGAFAFHFVRRLHALLPPEGSLEVVYVMTDIAQNNLQFCRQHPAWKPWIEAGAVDFACFDMGADDTLALQLSGDTLSARDADGPGRAKPLVVFANYVFDSVPTDLFRIADGRLEEGRVPPRVAFEADATGNRAASFADIGCPVTWTPVSPPCFEAPGLDALLAAYAQGGDGYVAIPTATLQAIDTLMDIAGGELLLLASDKGYARHHQLFAEYEPELALHNEACSVMVNFHALGEYVRLRGGDCVHQRTQQGLATSAFVTGQCFDALPLTRQAAGIHLNVFSPGDLFNLYTHMAETGEHCSLDTLISLLNITHWDPEVFNGHVERILALIEEADLSVEKDLLDGIPRVAENYYHLPAGADTMGNLGLALQALGRYREALACHEVSRRDFGDSEAVFHNLGLCHLYLENDERAVEMFEAAVRENPDSITAKGWLVQAREFLAQRRDGAPQAAAQAHE